MVKKWDKIPSGTPSCPRAFSSLDPDLTEEGERPSSDGLQSSNLSPTFRPLFRQDLSRNQQKRVHPLSTWRSLAALSGLVARVGVEEDARGGQKRKCLENFLFDKMQDKMLCNVNYPEGYTETTRILNVRRDYISLESKRRYFILQEKMVVSEMTGRNHTQQGQTGGKPSNRSSRLQVANVTTPFYFLKRLTQNSLTNNKFSRRYGNP